MALPVTITINDTPTIGDFSSGLNTILGQGSLWLVAFAGTWNPGDQFAFEIVLPAQTYDFGTGRMTKLVPVSAITLYNRVHFVAGTYWCGSDNGDATAWEQQAAGAFKIQIANQSQQPENLLALSSFQGRMALFSRHTTQLWGIDANPSNITQQQVLSNIGIVSPNAAQSLGDSDILFPSDSGIRSLKVQTINLNGFISDIGGPVDAIVKSVITAQSTTGICSAVEPTGNRYMVYFPQDSTYGTFLVLSYFPASKIVAWSTYTTYWSNGMYFTLTALKVFNSAVWFRGYSNTLLPSGGKSFVGTYGSHAFKSTYNNYDNVQAIATTPWLDLKNPGKRKTSEGVDVVIQGQWGIYGSMDFNGVNNGATLKKISDPLNKNSTGVFASAQRGLIPWVDSGYHVQLKAIANDVANPGNPAILSELVYYFNPGDVKP
jgi:hypothetical protein